MGCDIHTTVQVLTEGSGWIRHDELDAFMDDPGAAVEGKWWSTRNYYLFAALAGVRNSFGLDAWFPDRGVPRGDDCGPHGSDHSVTHATFAELLAADWDAEVTETYSIDSRDYDANRRRPDLEHSSCGWSSSQVTEVEYNAGARSHWPSGDPMTTYVQVRSSHRPLKMSWLYRLLQQYEVKAEILDEGAENLRMVMGFDS